MKIKIYIIGIKGSGLSSLVSILKNMIENHDDLLKKIYREKVYKACSEFEIDGVDTKEVFFSDEVLKKLNIKYKEGFDKNNIRSLKDNDFIIYSAAYNENNNEEIKEAKLRKMKMFLYTEFLGFLSFYSNKALAISGSHGKTTLTALISSILKEIALKNNFSDIFAILGATLKEFDNLSSMSFHKESSKKNILMIAEACEYRRNFLSFYPSHLIINNIEEDHLDYYKGIEDIKDAFLNLVFNTKDALIYNVEDKNTLSFLNKINKDLNLLSFGKDGDFSYKDLIQNKDNQTFKVVLSNKIDLDEFEITTPLFARHSILNILAAFASIYSLIGKENFIKSLDDIKKVILLFNGTQRRSQFLGKANGIMFYDDYGHHPTEIKSTLKGLKERYNKRIILDFASHTFTRSKLLLSEFKNCFHEADIVILNDIYPSARENKDLLNFTSKDFFKAIFSNKKENQEIYFIPTYQKSISFIKNLLKKDDIVLSMGAGDNFKVTKTLYKLIKDNK